MTGRADIPIRGGVKLMGERGELGGRPSLFADNPCRNPKLQPSFDIDDLLFGEFDAVKGTDVAVVTGGKWQISSGSTSKWLELNSKRRSSFRGAVVADFDGDGKSDIAFDEGRQMWSYSIRLSQPLHDLARRHSRSVRTTLVARDALTGARSRVFNSLRIGS